MSLVVEACSGPLASRTTPRRCVEVRTFVDLGPPYAAWSAAARLPRPAALVPFAFRPEGLPGAARSGGPPLLAKTAAHVRITSPANGLRVLGDPQTPAENATLALKAVVAPAAREVVWWADGEPYATAPCPYSVRWKVIPGKRTFEARLPFVKLASPGVTVRVE